MRALGSDEREHASMSACRFVPEPEISTVRLNIVEFEYLRDRSVGRARAGIVEGGRVC